MDITSLLGSKEYIIFDGALGTMLQKYGLKLGENPALMNVTSHDIVETEQKTYIEAGSDIICTNTLAVGKVHRMYIEAGSDIICANTFGANALALKNTKYSTEEIVKAAVEIAKRAAGDNAPAATESENATQPKVTKRPLVALDVGSLGEILEPAGDLSFEDAYNTFKEMAIAGEAAGADIAAIETFSDPKELRAAMTAINDNTKLPIFATMTFQTSGFTFMGCTPEKFAETAESLGAIAIGLNCSLEPRQMYDIAKRLAAATDLPLIIKPNAGLPDKDGNYNVKPEEFAAQMLPYKQLGVKVVGGCCGTTPEHIKALKEAFERQER